MARIILNLSTNEAGELWLDGCSPPTVHHEKTPPHRIAIRTKLRPAGGGQEPVDIWVRFERAEGYRVIDRLSDALQGAAESGADDITHTLSLSRILNGGADRETGEMVFLFQGKSGLQHRIKLPRDQSGLLTDFEELAASAAAQIADRKIAEAGSGIRKERAAPVDAEILLLQIEPLTGREMLNIRLANSLEYSFFLSEEQARLLRESPRPQGGSPQQNDPMH